MRIRARNCSHTVRQSEADRVVPLQPTAAHRLRIRVPSLASPWGTILNQVIAGDGQKVTVEDMNFSECRIVRSLRNGSEKPSIAAKRTDWIPRTSAGNCRWRRRNEILSIAFVLSKEPNNEIPVY